MGGINLSKTHRLISTPPKTMCIQLFYTVYLLFASVRFVFDFNRFMVYFLFFLIFGNVLIQLFLQFAFFQDFLRFF